MRAAAPRKLRDPEEKACGPGEQGLSLPLAGHRIQESCCEDGSPSCSLSFPSLELLKCTSLLGSALNTVSISPAGSHLILSLTHPSPLRQFDAFLK